jgi:uncharacterized membrane protein
MIAKTLRRHFLAGILVLTPTVVTIWILYKLFVFLDNLLGGFLDSMAARFLPDQFIRPGGIPGLGLISLILLVFLVGFLTNRFLLGRRLLGVWEQMVGRIPLVNRVFIAIKQISEAILSDKETKFRRVVLVEYPRRGIHSLAFVVRTPAGILRERVGEGHVALFLPTTPNPTSGFFLIVPESETVPLDFSVEEGLKLVISAGTVMPGEVRPGATVFMNPPSPAPSGEEAPPDASPPK